MRSTRDASPEAATTRRSPGRIDPEAMVPEKPRKSAFGRLTHCTGNRKGAAADAPSTSTVSRYSISVGPSYQPRRPERRNTLSPKRADSGIGVTDANPSGRAKAS